MGEKTPKDEGKVSLPRRVVAGLIGDTAIREQHLAALRAEEQRRAEESAEQPPTT